jgi:hypothetical protein
MLAAIEAVVSALTAAVATVNPPLDPPAGMVRLGGTLAVWLLLDNMTVTPPEGAAPLSVTVAAEGVSPTTLDGDSVTLCTESGLTASVAVWVTDPAVAVIVAVTGAFTVAVAIVKVALVCPAATVTVCGTGALPLELLRATERPPLGAEPVRVTVPVDTAPPSTEAGEKARPCNVGGATANCAVWLPPPQAAVMFAVWVDATAVVVMVNVATVLPAATVTVGGTPAQ